MKLVFILALLALLKSVLLYRVYHLLPLYELRRRARAHDPQASAIYKVAANDQPLDVLLYIVGFAAATYLIIAAAGYSWWWASIVILFIAWLSIWAPKPKVGGLLWRFSVWASPYTFKILSWLQPGLSLIANFLPGHGELYVHSGVYDKEDLLELINAQNNRADNRISEQDLKIAFGALSFGDIKVSKIMTPRRKVKFVGENDVVGPMLMDELHKTGFSRFPVVNGSTKSNMPNVVGTLFLKDIVEISQEDKGKVKDSMKRGAYFINESCDLNQALDAFLKNQHHQLVVVNNFEEMVGVITLEDVLEQIIGQPILDEFDKYDNLRAVANIEAEREKAAHKEIEPEPAAEETAEPEPAVE
ncbi:MAG TPA: CBS domain-containing protein [Candidatus Saccharimonadales bacterium]|nr:CBS domain-containing protein [Candidatus Saccharimonadales bacterium]